MRNVWHVREGAATVSWYDVRLVFADGARVEALAVVTEASVRLEDVRARPALSLDDLTALGDWLEGPLATACGLGAAPTPAAPGARRHARPDPPRGDAEQRLVADEYLAARERGTDPVLAVMHATGHGRRGALRLIGRARDAGLLSPRRARR
ncbi:DUF6214 family protein [Streptomyces fumanus]|uniref:DUF6214 family protein n=1 Tax=Streptomyces fumanus TaxID=67302 RepID=UPI0033C188B8